MTESKQDLPVDIDGIDLGSLVDEVEGDLLQERKDAVKQRIRLTAVGLSTANADLRRAEKEVVRCRKRVERCRSSLKKLKDGDWNALPKENGKQ